MKTLIIAEAGVNHNGSIKMALELIDEAKEAGADVVKFQTFKPEQVISRHAPKADYQVSTTGSSESQLDMVRKLQLSTADHEKLMQHAKELQIEFLSTPFDLPSVDLLTKHFNLPRLKLASGEVTNAPLLLKAAQSRRPLILSTGMCTLQDIQDALGVLAFGWTEQTAKPSIELFQKAYRSPEGQAALKKMVCLLHCTTEYPAPFDEINLHAMKALEEKFGLPVGYSDHSVGITVPIAAVALGATIIEKHYTLDRQLPGPDHRASLEPNELKAMVTAIRQVEASLGQAKKEPTASEKKNIHIARKSLVAAKAIRAGEQFSEENLTTKRPGSGVTAMKYYDWMGKVASRNFDEDEMITE